MTMQCGVTLRNDQAAAYVTRLPAGATLTVYTGAKPANCGTAASGTLLGTITLPATPLTNSGGVVTIAGTWSQSSAAATGTPGYFRLVDSSAVCHAQGDCGTDLVFTPATLTAGQSFSVTTGGTITIGGA